MRALKLQGLDSSISDNAASIFAESRNVVKKSSIYICIYLNSLSIYISVLRTFVYFRVE